MGGLPIKETTILILEGLLLFFVLFCNFCRQAVCV